MILLEKLFPRIILEQKLQAVIFRKFVGGMLADLERVLGLLVFRKSEHHPYLAGILPEPIRKKCQFILGSSPDSLEHMFTGEP